MKVAFAYPYNRRELLKGVIKGLDPDNTLYGFNYFKKGEVFLCEINETAEKILNAFLNYLNLLFVRQIDIDFKLARAILMIPQLNKADVIVSNIDGMSLAICFLKKLKLIKPPIIYAVGLFYIKGSMASAIENKCKNSFLNFYKWILSGADHILYHAQIEKQKLQALNIYNPATCTFLPMGSDDSYFKPHAKSKESNLVISIGKDRARDYKTLIQVASEIPYLNFTIVCRPSNIPDIDVPINVRILNDQPYKKIRELYQSAIMVVIPIKEMHRSSGQMTLTDTIQAQVPLVISDVVGIKHYNLKNLENSVIVKPENAKDLKQAILLLSKDTNLQNKIRKNLKFESELLSTRNYATKLRRIILGTGSWPKLCPISESDLEYLRNLRNNNNKYFLKSAYISKDQQLNWYKTYKAKNLAEVEYMFILRDKNNNCGTGAIYDINYKTGKAKIGRFIIDKPYRRKGYGDVFVKKITQLAFKKLALKKLELEVLMDNNQAIKLYLKHKFVPVKKTVEKNKTILIMALSQK